MFTRDRSKDGDCAMATHAAEQPLVAPSKWFHRYAPGTYAGRQRLPFSGDFFCLFQYSTFTPPPLHHCPHPRLISPERERQAPRSRAQRAGGILVSLSRLQDPRSQSAESIRASALLHARARLRGIASAPSVPKCLARPRAPRARRWSGRQCASTRSTPMSAPRCPAWWLASSPECNGDA
jgi:hypothetical protein